MPMISHQRITRWIKRTEKPITYLGNLIAIASLLGSAAVWLLTKFEYQLWILLCTSLTAMLLIYIRLKFTLIELHETKQAFNLLFTRECDRLSEQIKTEGLPTNNLSFAAALGELRAMRPDDKSADRLLAMLEQAADIKRNG